MARTPCHQLAAGLHCEDAQNGDFWGDPEPHLMSGCVLPSSTASECIQPIAVTFSLGLLHF